MDTYTISAPITDPSKVILVIPVSFEFIPAFSRILYVKYTDANDTEIKLEKGFYPESLTRMEDGSYEYVLISDEPAPPNTVVHITITNPQYE
jgi:hypothetical protein